MKSKTRPQSEISVFIQHNPSEVVNTSSINNNIGLCDQAFFRLKRNRVTHFPDMNNPVLLSKGIKDNQRQLIILFVNAQLFNLHPEKSLKAQTSSALGCVFTNRKYYYREMRDERIIKGQERMKR